MQYKVGNNIIVQDLCERGVQCKVGRVRTGRLEGASRTYHLKSHARHRYQLEAHARQRYHLEAHPSHLDIKVQS